MTTFESRPARVFISYASSDEPHMVELRRHLGVLIADGIIEVWTDKSIPPGDDWKEEIGAALDSTDIFVPLWSKYFFSSENCQAEQGFAEARRRAEKLRILREGLFRGH